MEATLEGEDVDVRIRSNKLDNETITWPELLANDYLHHLNDIEFEHICFYEQTSCYKKTIKANKITGVNLYLKRFKCCPSVWCLSVCKEFLLK